MNILIENLEENDKIRELLSEMFKNFNFFEEFYDVESVTKDSFKLIDKANKDNVILYKENEIRAKATSNEEKMIFDIVEMLKQRSWNKIEVSGDEEMINLLKKTIEEQKLNIIVVDRVREKKNTKNNPYEKVNKLRHEIADSLKDVKLVDEKLPKELSDKILKYNKMIKRVKLNDKFLISESSIVNVIKNNDKEKITKITESLYVNVEEKIKTMENERQM